MSYEKIASEHSIDSDDIQLPFNKYIKFAQNNTYCIYSQNTSTQPPLPLSSDPTTQHNCAIKTATHFSPDKDNAIGT